MRVNVIAIAFALAAPILAAEHQHGEHRGKGGQAGAGSVSVAPTVAAAATPSIPANEPAGNTGAASKNGQNNGNGSPENSRKAGAASSVGASPATPAPASGTKKGHSSGASGPSPTTAPSTGGSGGSGSGSGGSGGPGAMTWNIVNKQGSPLSLVYGNNAGGAAAVGNPSNGMLASSTQIVFPSGWAGRVIIGPNGDTAGSKIEGSVAPNFNVDVSYVDGFTVPITCADKSTGQTITGCNIPLFKNGQKCAKQGAGPICYNTEVADTKPDGPPDPFFAPCAGAAYTFPNDNDADRVSTSPEIDCCVGAACPAPARQKSKRSLTDVARRWAYPRHVFDEEK